MVRLSKRLRTVAELIPESAAVLDIGCDHAYVPLSVVGSGRCPCAVASDLREGPLRAAEEHIRSAGLADRIVTVRADGVPGNWRILMEKLLRRSRAGEDTPVCAVTAGMGGLLVRDIFTGAADRKDVRYWVASPQRDAGTVRDAFSRNGFEIRDERFVFEEGKYYPVILAEQTGARRVLSEEEALFGPVLLRERDGALLTYLAGRRSRLQAILEQLPEHADTRREEVRSEIALLDRVLL